MSNVLIELFVWVSFPFINIFSLISFNFDSSEIFKLIRIKIHRYLIFREIIAHVDKESCYSESKPTNLSEKFEALHSYSQINNRYHYY